MWRRVLLTICVGTLGILGVPKGLETSRAWAWSEGSPSVADSAADDFSRLIDQRLAQRWEEAGISPAGLSSDSEFFRRLHLDLTGHLPSITATRHFLADSAPDKRRRAIDQLLDSPLFAAHLAVLWRNRLLAGNVQQSDIENAIGLENWLREQFLRNLRYDNLVAEFLVAQGDGRSGPALYYTALELRPEKLAASSARIFLGVQMECAECHDHPFDHWTQRDFWSYAAFFAQLEQPPDPTFMGMVRVRDRLEGEVRIPESEEIAPPRFPGGIDVPDSEFGTRRAQLAIWLASRDNPYLARAAVNGVWAQLFGRGMVHPIDDHGPRNPPSHPELLEELAEFFVEAEFDLRKLFRVILYTEAYQRSSEIPPDEAEPPPELFARMQPKPLGAEQLYNCFQRGIGFLGDSDLRSSRLSNPLRDPQRLAFLFRMPRGDQSPDDYQSGLPQALLLMNGPTMTAMTEPSQSRLLQAISAPMFSTSERLDIILLATLCRFPTDIERARWVSYLDSLPSDQQLDGLGDILRAILNSAEFLLNH